MKQGQFYSPQHRLLAALLLLFVFAACSRESGDLSSSGEERTQAATNELVLDYPLNFDDSILEWTGLAESGNRARFSVVNDGRFINSFARQVEINTVSPGDPWNIQVYREDIPVEPHKIYNYTAWLRGPVGAQINAAVEGPDYLAMVNQDVI